MVGWVCAWWLSKKWVDYGYCKCRHYGAQSTHPCGKKGENPDRETDKEMERKERYQSKSQLQNDQLLFSTKKLITKTFGERKLKILIYNLYPAHTCIYILCTHTHTRTHQSKHKRKDININVYHIQAVYILAV